MDNGWKWPYKKEKIVKEIMVFLGFVGVWFLLQGYILPKLGVST